MLARPALAPLHEAADGGGGGVEDGHPVLVHDLPEAVGLGPVGGPLVHHRGGPVEEGPVDHIGVPRDPAHVGGAPVNVLVLEVKDQLGGVVDVGHVAARGVEHPLGLPGGAGGVEDEEGLLRLHGFGIAPVGGGLHELVPPVVPARGPGHLLPGAAHHHHVLHAWGVLQGLVGVLLQGHHLAAAVAPIGGNQHLGLGVLDAVGQGPAGEAPEDHGVHRPDAGAGEHGDGRLGDHGEVDGDPVALPHPQALKDVGELLHLTPEVMVGEDPLLPRLPLPDNGRLVAPPGLHVPVQGVVGEVGLSPHEPFGVGQVPFQDLLPGLKPVELRGHPSPEPLGVADALLVKALVLLLALDVGLLAELLAGVKDPLLLEHRLQPVHASLLIP